MSTVTKKKKLHSPQKSTGNSPKRKLLVWGLGLLALAIGVYYFIEQRDGSQAKDIMNDSGSEPTLTAKNPRLQLLSPAETGVDFQNQIVEDEAHNVFKDVNFYNGGGVAVADVNNDNLPDIYFVCNNGKNRLYLNQGNFKFKDITDQAGVGSESGSKTSVTAADVNADGWLDFYVCHAGPDEVEREAKLFINNGPLANGEGWSGAFTERAKAYGLNDKGPCSGSNFFDSDLDGDLDCYVINHPTDLSQSTRLQLKPASDGKSYLPDLDPKVIHDSDNFYRNETPTTAQSSGGGGGSPHFVNVSKEAGIQNFGFGLSVSATDLNTDGWPDIYVANDFAHPDNLFINNQKGGFTDQLKKYLKHNGMSTMGSDLSDFDNDGLVDIFTVDMFPTTNYRQKLFSNTNNLSRYLVILQYGYFDPVARNVLHRNNGNGTFSDLACLAGMFKTDWSWSALLADFDNDGFKDIHIANGYRKDVTQRDYFDFIVPEIKKNLSTRKSGALPLLQAVSAYKVRNFVYQNKGNWQFEDKSGDWMTMPGSWSGGGAWADFDADGDLDLVINNLEDPAFIYKNLTREQGGGNFIQAKLQGSPANPFAVGASVLIEYEGKKQYVELNPNRGIFSSVEHLIHFGIGQITQIDRLTVRWPDGRTQAMTNVQANQRLQLKWTDASGYVKHLVPITAPSKTLFVEKTPGLGANFKHTEGVFNDFEAWPLIPWTVTDLGPLTAKGDANGDGLDDFFVGNSTGYPGAVFLQKADGNFTQSSAAVFEKDKAYEDHGGLFFDADADQDLDLLVLGGGADAPDAIAWQCRLYLNDGKGNFSKSGSALPTLSDMALRVTAHDYDGDGDPDLFIGGRLVPKNWPLAPRSTVLRNDGGGGFTDVTAQVAGAFERCGMITDMEWADLNGDGQKELLVVGEWMPVSVFQLKNNKLENVTEQFGLAKTNGLWYRLALADLDKDGDLDLVTGNLGLNTRFTASPEAPFFCYAKDFDHNGTLDPIVAHSEGGKIYPLMQKDVMVKQMPVLKKKFLYSKDYATATMSEVWPQKDLDAALNLVVYDLETCWWENQGGKFVRHSLPIQAQTSPVQGIVCGDFNSDGNMDILMAGNKYGFEVETHPCDAGTGTLLLGDGKGNFSWLDNIFSGFWAMREARDLAMLRGAGGKRIFVVANTNSALQVFE